MTDTHRCHLVSDAGTMLSDADYLTEVVHEQIGDDESSRSNSPLLILEDVDVDLIAPGRTGTAAGRLLNLTDGLLGASTQIVVLMTTNAPLRDVSPAFRRPGRCLAAVEFGSLPRSEAAVLLGPEHPTPVEAMTLAEVFAARGDLEVIGSNDAVDDRGVVGYL